jgi:hypothetical protein
MLDGLYFLQLKSQLGASAAPEISVWSLLRQKYSALLPWRTATEMLAFIHDECRLQVTKDRLFRALLQEHEVSNDGVALRLLIQAMLPLLLELHQALLIYEQDSDELMGRILGAFIEAIESLLWDSTTTIQEALEAATRSKLNAFLYKEKRQKTMVQRLAQGFLQALNEEGHETAVNFLKPHLHSKKTTEWRVPQAQWDKWLVVWVREGDLTACEDYLIRSLVLRNIGVKKVAQVLGISEGSVRQRKHRVVVRLSQLLKIVLTHETLMKEYRDP